MWALIDGSTLALNPHRSHSNLASRCLSICILRFWVFENSEQHSWQINGLFGFLFFRGFVTTVSISTGPKSIELLSGASTFWMIVELDPSRLLISSTEVSLVASSAMNGKPASPWVFKWQTSDLFILYLLVQIGQWKVFSELWLKRCFLSAELSTNFALQSGMLQWKLYSSVCFRLMW